MGRAEPAIDFKTFGGRVNQADSDALERKFRAKGFASLLVFHYLKRSHTLAALNPDSEEESVKRDRVSELLELGAAGSYRHASRFSGTVREVLWESESDGWLTGLSDNYLRVTGPGEAELVGRLGPARRHVCADGTVEAVPLVAAMSGGA